MSLTIRIPFMPAERLGEAYNKEIESVEDWVLFLDHDVFLSLNPLWYDICINAIERLGHVAGWITCCTNQIGCPLQKADYNHIKNDYNYSREYDSNDFEKHFKVAEEIYKKNKGKILDITDQAKRWKLSGFFILTHKEAYNKVKDEFGLPDGKFIGWDNYYNDRLLDLGYKIFIMQDLYVFHGYKRLWKNKEWGK